MALIGTKDKMGWEMSIGPHAFSCALHFRVVDSQGPRGCEASTIFLAAVSNDLSTYYSLGMTARFKTVCARSCVSVITIN